MDISELYLDQLDQGKNAAQGLIFVSDSTGTSLADTIHNLQQSGIVIPWRAKLREGRAFTLYPSTWPTFTKIALAVFGIFILVFVFRPYPVTGNLEPVAESTHIADEGTETELTETKAARDEVTAQTQSAPKDDVCELVEQNNYSAIVDNCSNVASKLNSVQENPNGDTLKTMYNLCLAKMSQRVAGCGGDSSLIDRAQM